LRVRGWGLRPARHINVAAAEWFLDGSLFFSTASAGRSPGSASPFGWQFTKIGRKLDTLAVREHHIAGKYA
jgi:hypothetical protein